MMNDMFEKEKKKPKGIRGGIYTKILVFLLRKTLMAALPLLPPKSPRKWLRVVLHLLVQMVALNEAKQEEGLFNVLNQQHSIL